MASRIKTNTIVFFGFLLQYGADVASAAACSNVTAFSSQLNTVLAEYERAREPRLLTHVQLALDVRHVTMVEAQSAMRLVADLRMQWQDERLAWNSSAWGCDSAITSAELIWLPDITIINGGATNQAMSDTQPARIEASGNITWLFRFDVSIPIVMDLEDWPKDIQIGQFKFASRSLSTEALELDVNDKKFATLTESSNWEIVDIRTGFISEWEVAGTTRYVVTWRVRVRRRAPAHSLATNAVFVAVLVQLVAAMMLAPDARAPLCACSAFTATLWLMSAILRMPSSSSHPLSLSLMSAMCVAASMACVFAALVQRVARSGSAPPAAVRAALTAASAWCKLTPDEATAQAEIGAWAAAAKLLDYLLITALLLTLIVILFVYILG